MPKSAKSAKKRAAPDPPSTSAKRVHTPSTASTASTTTSTTPSSPCIEIVAENVVVSKPANQTCRQTLISSTVKQIQVCAAAVVRIFKDRIAEIIAPPGVGKTFMSGMIFSTFHRMKADLNRPGNTLVLSVSAEGRQFEQNKAAELGACNDFARFSPSKSKQVKMAEDVIDKQGICVFFFTQDAFAAWTKPVKKEAPASSSSSSAASKEDTNITYIVDFAMRHDVTDVILHIDEHSGCISKGEPYVFSSTITSMLKAFKSTTVKRKVDCTLRLLFTSAKHKEGSTNRKPIRHNMEIMYMSIKPLTPPVHRRKDGTFHLEDLERARARYVLKLSEDDVKELLDRGAWKTGENPMGGVRSLRSACILKDAGQDMSKEIMLFTPFFSDARNKLVFGEFDGLVNARLKDDQYVVKVFKTVEKRCAQLSNNKRPFIIFSANIILAARTPYRIVEDAIQLLNGNFNDTHKIHHAYDTRRPLKQTMRKVVTTHPQLTFKEVKHYKCVLVVLNVKEVCASLDKIRTFCMTRFEDTTQPTIIYNLIDVKAHKLTDKMNDIKLEFLKNERQVYIVTNCDQIVGSNDFSEIVDTVITIGCDNRQAEQADGRTGGRPNAPFVGQVVPRKGEYQFLSVTSELTRAVIGDSGRYPTDASLRRMEEVAAYAPWVEINDNVRDLLNAVEYKAYLKRFFVNETRNKEKVAKPVELVFGHTQPVLCKEFLELVKQMKTEEGNATQASSSSSSTSLGPFEERYRQFIDSMSTMKLSQYSDDDEEEDDDFKVKDEVREDIAELEDDDEDDDEDE